MRVPLWVWLTFARGLDAMAALRLAMPPLCLAMAPEHLLETGATVLETGATAGGLSCVVRGLIVSDSWASECPRCVDEVVVGLVDILGRVGLIGPEVAELSVGPGRFENVTVGKVESGV